jgi:peptidoglycan/xylan/chitin deacetylase (PgdA/CDA1 family)
MFCSCCSYFSSVCRLTFFLLPKATEEKYEQQEQNIKKSHEEALEKERIQNKKTITKQQEDILMRQSHDLLY